MTPVNYRVGRVGTAAAMALLLSVPLLASPGTAQAQSSRSQRREEKKQDRAPSRPSSASSPKSLFSGGSGLSINAPQPYFLPPRNGLSGTTPFPSNNTPRLQYREVSPSSADTPPLQYREVSPPAWSSWPQGSIRARDHEMARDREAQRYRERGPRYGDALPQYGYVAPGGSLQIVGRGSGGSITFFDGYQTIFVPGRTCASPFGAYYGLPGFISTQYVITTPYGYLGGREIGVSSVWSGVMSTGSAAASSPQRTTLRAALNDLSAFWEENDARALRRRIATDQPVAVFQNEQFLYSLRRTDFLALSSDALDRVTTLSFRFDDVRDRSDGLVNAYATHVYRLRGDSSSGTRTASVRYTLAAAPGGDWYVSAVSLSPDAAPREQAGRF